MPFKQLLLTIIFAAMTYGQHYSRLSGWCEQGNKTITVAGNTSSTNMPVQRSFPRCVVNVYTAGTVTPASLFSTATGTSLSNPISGDANGFWAFFIADGNYDLAFSGGTPGGIPVPYTLGSQPSVDPYFESSITGYIARTKNAKLADVVSVKDFGCVGNGSTDDTACLAAAWSYSDLSHCVYFPNGVYTTTQPFSKSSTSNAASVCWNGDPSGSVIKATSSMTTMVTLIGDPANNHSTLQQGTVFSNIVLDGGGLTASTSNATNGILFQGIVSAQMDFVRVRNVSGTALLCGWCQQLNALQFQVSKNTEKTAWVTNPTIGLKIDSISSANVFLNINIDHINGNGIELAYALNTSFFGGASEGNQGWGIYTTSVAPKQSFNNTWVQFDAEANGLSSGGQGDFYFGTGTFRNSVIQANSFTIPGIVFAGSAHDNNIIGGAIGGGSTAGVNTIGNRLIGVATTTLSGPVWTDLGQNCSDRIHNEFNGSYTEPVCYYQHTLKMGNSPAGAQKIETGTPADTHVYTLWGDQAHNWLGFDCQDGFPSCWFTYPKVGGMQFIGEDSPNSGAVNDGSIKNHQWCFGIFCQTALAGTTMDFHDAVATKMAIRGGAGQGGSPLLRFMSDDGATTYSQFEHNGVYNGPVGPTATIPGSTGHAVCVKSDSTIGTCSTVVASDGTCTCS